MEWTIENDRRKSFRIEEHACVDFHLIPPALVAESIDMLSAYFALDTRFLLGSQLRRLDFELEELIGHSPDLSPAMIEMLNLLNRKINLVASQNTSAEKPVYRPITLSEGGLSFYYPEEVTAGSLLILQIQFEDDQLGLVLKAKSCYSQLVKDGNYRVGCEFIELDENQQQLLSRHILEHQARSRRQARDQDFI